MLSREGKDLRRRLVLMRDRRKLKHTEIAKLTKCAEATVSDWFNPEREGLPSAEALALLPAAFECDGHWLLTGDGAWTRHRTDEAREAALRAEGAGAVLSQLRAILDELDRTGLGPTPRGEAHLQDERSQAEAARRRGRRSRRKTG